jgi:hypothetical protein
MSKRTARHSLESVRRAEFHFLPWHDKGREEGDALLHSGRCKVHRLWNEFLIDQKNRGLTGTARRFVTIDDGTVSLKVATTGSFARLLFTKNLGAAGLTRNLTFAKN